MDTNHIKKEKYICPAIEVITMDTERPYAVNTASNWDPGIYDPSITNSKRNYIYSDDDTFSDDGTF